MRRLLNSMPEKEFGVYLRPAVYHVCILNNIGYPAGFPQKSDPPPTTMLPAKEMQHCNVRSYLHKHIYMVQRCQPPPPPPPMVMGQTSTPPPPCGCGPVVGLWWFRVGLELV